MYVDGYEQARNEESEGCRGAFLRLAVRQDFNYVCGSAVILNVMWIGFSVDNMSGSEASLIGARNVDACFCMFFVIELLIRLIAYGPHFFTMSSSAWNIFDLVLVVTQVAELGFEWYRVMPGTMDTRHVNRTEDLLFRVIRIIRMARILRLIRLVRFVGELRTILASILGSISCLMWTLVLLLVVMYGVGVCMRQIVVDDPSLQTEALDRYFSSLPETILSLYAAITGGQNWKDMVDALFQHGR